MLRNKERRALRERSSPIVGEVIRRRNARSMDGAAQSSYLSQGGSYLRKSHVIGDRGAVDTHTHLPTDVMGSAGSIALLGHKTVR